MEQLTRLAEQVATWQPPAKSSALVAAEKRLSDLRDRRVQIKATHDAACGDWFDRDQSYKTRPKYDAEIRKAEKALADVDREIYLQRERVAELTEDWRVQYVAALETMAAPVRRELAAFAPVLVLAALAVQAERAAHERVYPTWALKGDLILGLGVARKLLGQFPLAMKKAGK